ncbi:MAG: hypothetical protein ABW321_32530 [Polyangiales bacterium]
MAPREALSLSPAEVETEAETGVLITGAVILASSYVTTVAASVFLTELFRDDYRADGLPCKPCAARNWTLVPVAGPFLESTKTGFLPDAFTLFFGMSQAFGAATTLIGLAQALESERPRPAVLSSREVHLAAVPTASGAQLQLSVPF